ncbi:NADH:flavin oxidoreductase [Leifsonia shinshuensis]|uniref:2,4-dienoyl-CoA reductase-like NADH-dependent reductase (Old Yellow Enzyme family) n=1 Tax=Leifsonia shinshuensis TaxID=150026 RepID=A0A853CW00_9MICO|nr:NADH:flavin oxidoreductase [Leifsonia shinshuensis]NYJ24618.1 2,4-dienoyl-CoA reductase-like NADH-dependent reductase (Old Yellow Enzyme family) [Leifsonia shinshuensis]
MSLDPTAGPFTTSLHDPARVGPLELRNRFVMAPMTREFSPGGIPSERAASYYARRARGGVGLIVTEGTVVNHPAAAASANVPRFHGEQALARWKLVVDAVHAEGGKIVPQLWHVGLDRNPRTSPTTAPNIGPHVWFGESRAEQRPMTHDEIEDVVRAFGQAAVDAETLGFDGVEVHGGHGYLVDQFLWERTNVRTDGYAGSVAARSRFAAEIVEEIRRRVSPDFPIIFRFSQWKTIDFEARPYDSPETLEKALAPIAEAGADLLHASTRRFWLPEFDDSDLNLAGWAKKVTGLPTITVGSIGLEGSDFVGALLAGEGARPASLTRLEEMLCRGDFDLVALGRAFISDPDLVTKLGAGNDEARTPFDAHDLMSLI